MNKTAQAKYDVRKVNSIDDKNSIEGRVLYTDIILEGKLVKEEWKDEKGVTQKREYRLHVYPTPGKEIIISGKKFKVHSVDIPSKENRNKTINVL